MRKIQIRSTDLQINPVGLGTNAVGGQRFYPDITDEAGRELLHEALAYHVDFWDTAFSYGPEKSERIIGEVLQKTKKRKDVILATKAAHRYEGNTVTFDNSPAFLKQAVDDALGRLQTDYIDLFYLHYPDETTPKYEAIGALKDLKDAGKIRAIGVSNFSMEQLMEANQDGHLNVVQGEYNLLKRGAEKELIPYTLQHGISFVPYFPLASGLLTGKFDENTIFPESDSRSGRPQFQGEAFKQTLEKMRLVREIASAKGVGVANVVLAWYLEQEGIDGIIPGAKSGAQVIDNQRTLDVVLSPDEIQLINQTFD